MNISASDPATTHTFTPQLISFAELAEHVDSTLQWLWQGYVARGSVTLLTSQWKTGKTTLLTVLLSKLHHGGAIGGLTVTPGSVCVVSEESAAHWRRRGERFDFGPRARFCCRPFRHKPDWYDWDILIKGLQPSTSDAPFDLVVIDTLSALIPAGVENQADAMLEVLRPLDALTAAGTAVLLMHHPRKGQTVAGQAARGSGALCAYADILVEMRTLTGARPDDRRRRLSAWSRYDATPRDLIVELSADGTEFSASAEDPPQPTIDDDQERGLAMIVDIFERTGEQQTREAIVRQWPDRRTPNAATVWRWLECGVKRGLFVRHGTGKRSDPFRYQLPGRKCAWNPSHLDMLDLIDL